MKKTHHYNNLFAVASKPFGKTIVTIGRNMMPIRKVYHYENRWDTYRCNHIMRNATGFEFGLVWIDA